MNRRYFSSLLPVLVLMFCCFQGDTLQAASPKVMVVMSYDKEYAWEQEIRDGVAKVLEGCCSVEWFYLDTKRHLEGGTEMAQKAYEFYRQFQPDGVIAADDNAQSMFVVPYLKNKVDVPVVFCGVNADPKQYGYPASNVTGITERLHIRSSIAFAQQLLPSIKKMGFILKDSPSTDGVFQQYEREYSSYPVESVAFERPTSFEEALAVVRSLKDKTDAVFFETMEGVRDKNGRILVDQEIIPLLAKEYGKPIISNNLYHVEFGTLCAVTKTGQEQGQVAAEILLRLLEGTPISEIPITVNRKGKKVINLRIMKEMGLKPGSDVLMGVHLVDTE